MAAKKAKERVVGRASVGPESWRAESFDFTMHGFKDLPHNVGKWLRSPTFELCGSSWFLEVYPGGIKQDSAGYVSVYLYSAGPALTVDYRVQLFAGAPSDDADDYDDGESSGGDGSGESKDGFEGREPIWTEEFIGNKLFQAAGTVSNGTRTDNWGCQKTLTREIAISRSLGDAITVRASVRKLMCVGPQKPKLERPHPTLSRDLGALFESGDGCDVVLRSSGCEFRVHKLILSARSRVLRAMFDGRFKEGSSSSAASGIPAVVDVAEVDAETLERLLRFIYTGKVKLKKGKASKDEKFDAWARLLASADRFDIEELFKLAQFQLAHYVTKQNAAYCLAIAHRFSTTAEALKTAALDEIVRNGVPEDLVSSDLDPALLVEILKHAQELARSAAPKK